MVAPLQPNATLPDAPDAVLPLPEARFGRIVFTEHLYPGGPFLDPAKPLPREHIERTAEMAKVPSEEIDDTVQSLSAHLGWDITQGAAG